MPLSGGESDKIGNRYEGRWIVYSMIEVLDERAISIRIEPPGKEGEGAEFWLQREMITEYHQVKRQNTKGRWTNSALKDQGVLTHFITKLGDLDVCCVFISTDRAFELDELSERARRSRNIEEFQVAYLNTENYRKLFSDLCRYWGGCQERQAFVALQRIRVETLSERQLETAVETRITALVEGEASTIAAVLTQFALDRIGFVLTAHEIWTHLEAQGFSRRNWGNDPHVLSKVHTVNQLYLNSLRKPAVGDDFIPREEVTKTLEFLKAPEAKAILMLVGGAGVGKSSVLYLTATSLIEMGWPVLAFRIDRLQPVLLPKAVGVDQLDLPASPAHVLASIAQHKDSVLLIDQLDAVSLASGRHPDFFACINEIIAEALSYPGMRVLLACRTFDLQNDYRLRQLTDECGAAKIVEVKPLTHDSVYAAVERLNLDPAKLRANQIALLSIPLHLRLLAEVTKTPGPIAFTFDSVRDLFDSYWKNKQRTIRNRLGRDVKWTSVIDTLCDYMSNNQVLYAPEEVVDDHDCTLDAEIMASENVLLHELGRYFFFHETFFDYAFARRFVTKNIDLLDLLFSKEQHLFRRAQVRQLLAYQREVEFPSYLTATKDLLESQKVRFHLKQVIFALLHQLNDPHANEWGIIKSYLSDSNSHFAWEVWRTIRGSIPWFDLLVSQGVIEQWLADEDSERVDQAVQFLASIQNERPDQVAEFVEPFVAQSGDWNNRLVYLVRVGNLSRGHRFFDLFLRLLDSGILDEIEGFAANSGFWNLIYSLPNDNPDFACKAISHGFQRVLTISLTWGETNPFRSKVVASFNDELGEHVILESAKGAPKSFIKYLLPFMLDVIRLNLSPENGVAKNDRVWEHRSYGKAYGLDGAMLRGMEIAFQELAMREPAYIEVLNDELLALNLETIQYLVIRGCTANAERFSDRVVEHLTQNPSLLKTGYTQNKYWATRELIEAISQHCSETSLFRLEDLLLNYYPPSEKDKWGYRGKRFGYAQYLLLEGITPSRRSIKVERRIQEHRRSGKFYAKEINDPPETMEFKSVPPPLPEKAARKMTDSQWLHAISTYQTDELVIYPGKGLTGGADQLARLLQDRTREEPERFAKLTLRIPDHSNHIYANAILLGLSETQVEVEALSRACYRCHELPNHPCGYAITTLISKQSRQDLPTGMFDLIAWYATEGSGPEPRERSPERNVDLPTETLFAGINSVRGRAAGAIAHLIFAEPSRCRYFLPVLQEMVRDPNDSVKACVAEALIAAINFDRDIAVELFIQLCTGKGILLATHHVERFLYYTIATHYRELEPILNQMLQSLIDEVRMSGARQMTVASMSIEDAKYHIERNLTGDEAQQQGVAEVLAANLHSARWRDVCETALAVLFNSPHEKVRATASRCFDGLSGSQLAAHTMLGREFAQSLAFNKHYRHILRALETTTAKLPDTTLLICERFVDVAGAGAGDFRTAAAADSNVVTKLIIRVYGQNEGNQDIQSRCLDLIDSMTQHRAYGLDKALESFER